MRVGTRTGMCVCTCVFQRVSTREHVRVYMFAFYLPCSHEDPGRQASASPSSLNSFSSQTSCWENKYFLIENL